MGQEGQIAGVVGQEGMAGARCGRSSVSKEGQMVNKGGDGRVQEGQMAVSVGGGALGEMAGSQMGKGKWGQGGPDGQGGRGWQDTGGPDSSFCGWWDRRGDGKEPYGAGAVEARRAKWLEREGMAGCRRARWQLLGQWGGRTVAG